MVRFFVGIVLVLGSLGLNPAFAQPAQAPTPTSAEAKAPEPVAEPPAESKPALTPKRASTYRINVGDQLEVYVWGEERLQRGVKVLPDGTIAFPLVGQIHVQGSLPGEVETMITAGLRDQYRGQVPQVTVSVVVPAGLQFSVMGKVKNPGNFVPGRYVNALDALSLAGGPAEFANLDNILILRKSGDALQSIRVRLASLFKTGAGADDISRANIVRIESGDTMIVP